MKMRERIEEIMGQINSAAGGENRPIICLATKTQGIEVLEEAKAAGLNLFGENRVQELLGKYDRISEARWHFIGKLQTNKVKYIIDKVELIHSVDRMSLALEIDRQAKKHNLVMQVLIEINLAEEEQRGGVFPAELPALADGIVKLENVRLKGLMTVMPLVETPFNPYEKMQRLFYETKNNYPFADIKYLSMGMSGDFLTAIQYGSNILRLGRAIFGERDSA